MSVQTAKNIYDRIKEFGLTRAQVRKLLPAWWDTEAEKFPDGIAELCTLISRRLSLDAAALMNGQVKQKLVSSLAYKHRVDATPQSLQGATSIALSLAHAVATAMPTAYSSIPTSPEKFAAQVRKHGNGLIGLRSMISACWAMGVPVVPMPNLPVGLRKMDGAVIKVGTRPVILISKKKSSQAWLAFIVAHEIGHVGCRHLEKDGSIIDVSLQEQATYETDAEGDVQEREADHYALSLLGGDAVNAVVSTWSTWASPVDLAVKARTAHKALGVESGHLILRYAFITKRWPDAVAALRFLSEDADAEGVMRAALQDNLDFDLIADDLRDLVYQVTGIEEELVK